MPPFTRPGRLFLRYNSLRLVVFCRDNQDTVAAVGADVIGDDALVPLDDGNGGAAGRAADAIGELWLFFQAREG